MAKAVSEITLGIDVAKHELLVHCWEDGHTVTLGNDPRAIRHWLQTLDRPARLALEPTSTYHLELLEQACAQQHAVYLINPRQLAHYREVVNLRHKSDPDDAWLLARFLAKEGAELRRVALNDRRAQTLWTLLKRRASVVEARKQLQQSLSPIDLPHRGLMTQFKVVLARIDQRIRTLIDALGWRADYRRCLSIPGIGPVNAAALVAAFNRGSFANSNAFIAFLGLDIRRRESGAFKGKPKLSKRGEPELRRLLYCAAQPARCHPRFDAYYHAQIQKGRPKTAAKVCLARKLARIAFALINQQQSFNKQIAAYSQSP